MMSNSLGTGGGNHGDGIQSGLDFSSCWVTGKKGATAAAQCARMSLFVLVRRKKRAVGCKLSCVEELMLMFKIDK